MSIRDRLSTILDEITDETLKEMIDGALNASKLKWGLFQPDPCTKCGFIAKPKKVQVDYPDLDKRAKMFAVLADQAKGKPAETKKVSVDVGLRSVKELTDSELEQIVAGSLPELPPAA